MDTKTKILKSLQARKGQAVSGSVLARDLGISRTAVWKAINSLREAGHLIEGGSGTGYVLREESDKLSELSISRHLKVPLFLHVLDKTDSTNKDARRLAISDPKGTHLIVANEQTEGRGRLGRSFYSPAGSGLYMSFLFRPVFPAERAVLATAAAAVSVARAVRSSAGLECGIKWVNDLYYNGKKVCGILTEAAYGVESKALDYLIIGIGINCHPADLSEKAGHTAGDLGGGLSRNELAAKTANELIPVLKSLDPADFMSEYRERSIVTGKHIRIFGSGFSTRDKNGIPATALDITDEGGLAVRFDDGTTSVLSTGEITIREDNCR